MFKLAAWSPLLLLVAGMAAAQEGPSPDASSPAGALPPRQDQPWAKSDESRDFVRIAFNFYDQNDRGGNPFLDEDVTTYEGMILLGVRLSSEWAGTFKIQMDSIQTGSGDASGDPLEGGVRSAASDDRYIRVDANAFYAWSPQTTVGGGLIYATEYDYRSAGLNGTWTHTTSDGNDSYALKVGAFFDEVDLIRFDDTSDGTDTKNTYSLGVGWSRVLTPRTVGAVNWDITVQKGFLATPTNSVVAAGMEVDEVLPDSRVRNALNVRLRHLLLADLAVQPGVGFYVDDWGATAINVEVKAFWEVSPGFLLLQPSYRFHSQSEVDDFLSRGAATIPEFRTQDSDLGDLSSHVIGLKVVFPNATFLGPNMEFEVGGNYMLRSDDVNSWSFTLGYVWRW